MARMVGIVILVVVMGFIVWSLSGLARGISRDRRTRRSSRSYDFESRYEQTRRRMRGVQGPAEDREGIVAFARSRNGVEGYIEPKTVASPLSVVLVAGDGEWKRFELADDSFIRSLAKDLGIPTFDAARVGYPQRMRDYKRRSSATDDETGTSS